MKETKFIDQNKEKWLRFEKLYASKSNDPEELSELYMDITDDLSYARTFYKRRTVRVYLNQLAQKVFNGVQKQKRIPLRKFIDVWRISLPLEIYRSRKALTVALISFIVYALIGAISTHFNPDFPKIVLGEGYVQMTIENIKKGQPLKVYESSDQLEMFIRITTNNLKVAFLTFFVGFFFTIGTQMMLFFNGVMLGSFQYFFHLKGLLVTSFLGIWIHGAFEISAIVLAAGAGITVGNGFLFPGSYSRLQSLQIATKRGLKIMMSLVPFIIAAGFLESYVTHHYDDLKDWSKWFIILFSFATIFFIYVIYPIAIARKYPELLKDEEVLMTMPKNVFEKYRIRNLNLLLGDSFQFYRLYALKFFKAFTLLGIPFSIVLIVLQDTHRFSELNTEYWYDWASQIRIIFGYDFKSYQDVFVGICWTLIFAWMATSIFWCYTDEARAFERQSIFLFAKKNFLSVWLGTFFISAIVFVLPGYILAFGVLLLPFFFLHAPTLAFGNESLSLKLKKAFRFSRAHYGKSLSSILLLVFFTTLLAQPFAFILSMHEGYRNQPLVPDFLDLFVDLVKRVLREYTSYYLVIGNIIRQLFYLIFFFTILPFFYILSLLAFDSMLEINELPGLKKALQKFGLRSRYHEKSSDYE